MQALFEPMVGKAALKQIFADLPADAPSWNEAQNRFQFVDRLLCECLGWDRTSMEVEQRDEYGGISDYVLGRPTRATLEAKKEAVLFDILPSGRAHKARRLRSLIDACAKLKAAVMQVIQYCAMNASQLAIVCNGPQMIIFQVNVPGMPPLDGDCFVFDGFSAYSDRFTQLWRLISPEAIFENRAARELAIARNPRIPEKPNTAIDEPFQLRYRSDLQENLQTLGSVLISDIDDEPEVKPDFYRECYVSLEANNRHLLLSKKIIAARYTRATEGGTPAALTTKVVSGRVRVDDDFLDAGSAGSRPVVVIGDVGVGKTSFFEFIFEQLDESEKSKTVYIHINLAVEATLSQNIKSYILENVPLILRKGYNIDINSVDFVERLYKEDIASFDGSVEAQIRQYDPAAYQKAKIDFLREKINNKDTHLRFALVHIVKKLNRQVMLVIDNTDQRNYDVQQEAFLIAQELASLRALLVFIALRPSTFYESKLRGTLSGYQNRVLTIAPPAG